jgi:hypothetical protein
VPRNRVIKNTFKVSLDEYESFSQSQKDSSFPPSELPDHASMDSISQKAISRHDSLNVEEEKKEFPHKVPARLEKPRSNSMKATKNAPISDTFRIRMPKKSRFAQYQNKSHDTNEHSSQAGFPKEIEDESSVAEPQFKKKFGVSLIKHQTRQTKFDSMPTQHKSFKRSDNLSGNQQSDIES